MDDFITLSCPTCGGKLTVDKDAKDYVCEYCGRQHIIRPENKEFHAKCPLCQRNDKVDKVTALYSVYGFSNNNLAPPEHPDKIMDYSPDPKPQFTEKPIVKGKPSKLSGKIIFYYILLVITIGAFFAFYINLNHSSLKTFYGILILLLLGTWILITGTLFSRRRKEKREYKDGQKIITKWEEEQRKISEKQKDWKTYKIKYDKQFEIMKVKLINKYKKAMVRYNMLYYCRRDDCVFIPGENGYAPASELNDFVYKGITD